MPRAKTKRPLRKIPKLNAPSEDILPASPTPWYYEQKHNSSSDATPTISSAEPLENLTSPTSAPARSAISCWLLAAAIAIFPFISFPWTLSPQELPKQIALTIFTAIGLIIVLAEYRKTRTLSLIPRHPSVLLGLLALGIAAIGAFRSGLIYQSWFGAGGSESLSLASMGLLGLWTLLVFHGGQKTILLPLKAIILSGSILSLLTILSLLDVNPYRFMGETGLNPAGTVSTVALLAATTLIINIGLLLRKLSPRSKILWTITLLPPLILLFGAGVLTAFIAVAIGSGILLLHIIISRETSKHPRATILLAGVTLLGIALSMLLAWRPTYHFLKTPLEVSPTHHETWSIVKQTLARHPLLGSGPATFSADYLAFHSLPISQTPFWNLAFDWGSSAILTLFTNLGILGGGLLLLGILTIFFSYLKKLFRPQLLKTNHTDIYPTLLASGVTLLVLIGLAPAPLALGFLMATLLGLLLAASVSPLSGNHSHTVASPLLGILIRYGFIILIVVSLLISGLRVTTEALAYSALEQSSSTVTRAISRLNLAMRLNPLNDLYPRLLADAYRFSFRQSLNDPEIMKNSADALPMLNDKANLILKAGLRATKLAPRSSAAWTTLGNGYLEIAPLTAGVLDKAQAAFTTAQELSPSDPTLSASRAMAAELSTRELTPEQAAPHWDSAMAFLKQALDLRAAYPTAHLKLARLLGQQQKLEEALTSYRNVEALLPKDASIRYEVGLFLLQNKREDEARSELETAVQLASNFSNARWYLAQVYENQNALDKAIEQIQKVLELNPDNQQAKDRLAELQNKASKSRKTR